MSMSAFERRRVSLLPVMEFETKRSMANNEARWKAHHLREKISKTNRQDADESEKLEHAAMLVVGQKTEEGIKMGEEGGVVDLPLRKDHAASISGRAAKTSHEVDLTPMERLHERVPSGETANSKLAEYMQSDQPGPPPELVREAAIEVAPLEEKEAVAKQFDDRIAAAEKKAADVAEGKEARYAKERGEKPKARATPKQRQAAAEEKKAKVEAELPAPGHSAHLGDKSSNSKK